MGSKIYLIVALLALATFTQAQTCETGDCHINAMPLYAQHNMAFPNNGNYFCAPATTAMMIQSQLDKPGVTVPVGSWTYNHFLPYYTTEILAEALEMGTDPYRGTIGYMVHLGFTHLLEDVINSDGTPSVYSQGSTYPTQRSLSDYQAKLREGYAIGLLIEYEKENRIYDGFPACHLVRYEYHKSGGHFVGVRGYDGNNFFINNPLRPSLVKKGFHVMPHTKNGLPVLVYEEGWLVPDALNVNYIGSVTTSAVRYPCPPNNANCQCDLALGITRTPVYATTPEDYLYLAH